MNKLIICFFFMLVPQVCFGEDSHWVDQKGNQVTDEEVADFMKTTIDDGIAAMVKDMLPVYQSMKTCAPAKSEYLQVLGKENDLCHFTYVDYNCLVPQDIAEEYADLGLKSIQDMIQGNISTESPEAVRMQEILSDEKYCSFAMTWSVTMEDEDGNEVPVEGITVE